MKVQITGASNFVNRMFEACGRFQWARELLKNSIEAEATRVEFGIEWQAVANKGIYRRTIIDDGQGMNREELFKFFSTLGEGGKKIGGVHDNFGVGAKIASMPWNPDGLVVISYKDSRASMIWIMLDEDSGDYELVEFETDAGNCCVVDPASVEDETCEWDRLRPDWLQDHGTIVVLLGSESAPHTVLGNPLTNESDIKGLSSYLNARFWDLADVIVSVTELRSPNMNQWPVSAIDRDDARRPNNRRIQGARHFLTGVTGPNGKPGASGTLQLDQGRVRTEWYLWEGERPAIHSYAKKGGYIAIRYNDELFELTSSKPHFRWFGVIESKVQQNLTLILGPQLYESASSARWGVHPDQSRNRLIFSGEGEKGGAVPLSDWGLEFADHMPEAVLDAIRAARGKGSGSIDDDEYRKRLQDQFGDRWSVKVRVEGSGSDSKATGEIEDDNTDVFPHPEHQKRRRRRKARRTHKAARRKARDTGNDVTQEQDAPVSIPRYEFAPRDNFEEPWHLALWAPNDPQGPTVFINVDAPILQNVVEYHQNNYPDVYAEDVADTVRRVFGEVAVAKVAHSQKLTKEVPLEVLDQEYRNEKSLTLGLLGLLAEDSLITGRLIKLGRKRKLVVA